jgi:Family of unknown function (DUF6062)
MESDSRKSVEKPAEPAVPEEKDILKDLQHNGCPVCNHMEEVIFDFLAKWQYALTNDKKVQREYAAELGFCPAHTWQLSAISSARGISHGYPRLLEHIAEELAKLNGASPDISNGIAALLKKSESCRVCRLLQDTEEMYMRRLTALLEQEDTRVAYAHSHGVCLRHLSLLVPLLTSREVVRFVLSEKSKHLKETAEDMQRYALKHEALERHRINRDERYAYLRALVHIAGARNVCAPHIRRI